MPNTFSDIEEAIDELSNQIESGALPPDEINKRKQQLEVDLFKVKTMFTSDLEQRNELVQKIFALGNAED